MIAMAIAPRTRSRGVQAVARVRRAWTEPFAAVGIADIVAHRQDGDRYWGGQGEVHTACGFEFCDHRSAAAAVRADPEAVASMLWHPHNEVRYRGVLVALQGADQDADCRLAMMITVAPLPHLVTYGAMHRMQLMRPLLDWLPDQARQRLATDLVSIATAPDGDPLQYAWKEPSAGWYDFHLAGEAIRTAAYTALAGCADAEAG